MAVEEIQISQLMYDCLGSQNDINSHHVKVDSLMNFSGWVNTKMANRHFEDILNHVKKLPKPFLNPVEGWSFLHLGHYDDGQGGIGEQWGEDLDAGCLIVLCAYYGIFQDPLKTLGFSFESLGDLPGGVTYCSFNTEPHFINMVRSHLVDK